MENVPAGDASLLGVGGVLFTMYRRLFPDDTEPHRRKTACIDFLIVILSSTVLYIIIIIIIFSVILIFIIASPDKNSYMHLKSWGIEKGGHTAFSRK